MKYTLAIFDMDGTILYTLQDITDGLNYALRKNDLPEITLEKVRGILAEKSRSGHTAEVRAILRKFGADRLSDIDPKDYGAVLKEAEVL